MNDFKNGDQVQSSSGFTYTVHAVDGDWVWVSRIRDQNGVRVDQVIQGSLLTKIKIKFESGKRYRRRETPYQNRKDLIVTVVAVNDEWAIGWWGNEDPWQQRVDDTNEWVKIS